MKRLFLLICGCLSALAAAGNEGNILKNGGFEKWSRNKPASFAVAPKSGAPIAADSQVVKDGKFSLKISDTTGKSARLTQHWIAIKDIVNPIRISGWIKYENLAAKDAAGKRCPMPIIGLWTYLPNGRNGVILPAVECKPGSKDWFRFEKVFTPQELAARIAKLPEKQRPAHLNFRITVYSQPGTVWLDNVEMVELEEQNSTDTQKKTTNIDGKKAMTEKKFAKFDLHLHTVWSYDGCAEVEEHIRRAADLGLRCMAITEHNNMDSWPEVAKLRSKYPRIKFIPGVEFSVQTEFGSIDIVCLNMPEKPTPELEKVFLRYRKWYNAQIEGYLNAVNHEKPQLSREAILRALKLYRPDRVVALQGLTMPHGRIFRNVFIEEKLIADRSQWNDFMEPYWQYYKALPKPKPEDVIPHVKAAGGLVFIAHPKKYFNGCDYERMEKLRKILQLDGIECAHPSTPPELSVKYREYCVKNNLLSSAGSDAHTGYQNDFLKIDDGVTLAGHDGKEEWLDEILQRINAK